MILRKSAFPLSSLLPSSSRPTTHLHRTGDVYTEESLSSTCPTGSYATGVYFWYTEVLASFILAIQLECAEAVDACSPFLGAVSESAAGMCVQGLTYISSNYVVTYSNSQLGDQHSASRGVLSRLTRGRLGVVTASYPDLVIVLTSSLLKRGSPPSFFVHPTACSPSLAISLLAARPYRVDASTRCA